MADLAIAVADARGMRALGAALARHLVPGTVVHLSGPLGAGKTTLAQGIAAALGVTGRVISPTFVIVREYRAAGGIRFVHMDFYRLGGRDEAADLGLGDDIGAADTIVAIEWPERGGDAVPEEGIHVDISMAEGDRRAAMRAIGADAEATLRALAADAAGGVT